MRYRPSLTLLVLSTLLLCTGATVQVKAQSHDVLSGFQLTGEYQFLIDGRPVEAQIGLSQRAAALLVTSDSLDAPLLVFARTKRVDQLDASALLRGDGEIDLRADVQRTYLGDFQQDGQELVLPGEAGARLRPKPPLLGPRELGDVLQHSPGYREGMKSYRIDPGTVAKLAAITKRVKIRVVFGSWCSHCKHYLPHVLKLEQSLPSSKLDFDYYGIDYPPAGWEDSEVKALGVTGLPTAIVYIDGKEAGRFSGGTGFEKIEARILDVLD